MRIISGIYRGKILKPPKNFNARPTTDFAKESLFNILHNLIDIEQCKVLDLFAGTGSISYEFASRNALSIASVEQNPAHYRYIHKTAGELGFETMHVIQSDAFGFILKPYESFDIVFADPPFDHPRLKEIPDLVLESGILLPEGWFILEHPSEFQFRDFKGFYQQRTYGSVNFTLFQKTNT